MKVLLAVGGTEGSYAALDEAIARAAEAGDDLTVAVVERDDVGATAEDIEAAVRDRVAESDVDAAVRRVDGHAGAQLVELADDGGFDRLVLTGGERSSLGKIQLDEMIEFVLLNSETTVTLVR
ncbi:universal stress protein [Halorientalis litorea]|jgi:nucleotide-binding universal stress UspA family protein|uniref:universal stress protein n=1 Tax=Halorientalis litorea TaxID=2931977 RepID=UPI001FF47AF5|nr:universal stress protein [Halorientalis litorea]